MTLPSSLLALIRKHAALMHVDEAVLADVDAYSCTAIKEKVVKDAVAASPDSDIATIPPMKDRIAWDITREIERIGQDFKAKVVENPTEMLGFDLNSRLKRALTDDFCGAFVHRIARDTDGEIDMEKFVATRRAWLKFLTENV